jgi:F-type H+-transporting ATPase subunit gamma
VANLKAIRKRISSVKSTQKITRAMKMVAGARLARAQQRILALRPYAVKTGDMLREVTTALTEAESIHPLLAVREEKRVLFLVVTSDRGLCGAFNANILRAAERLMREKEVAGVEVSLATIGRKGRDHFRRRSVPLYHVFEGVWEKLDIEQARHVSRTVVRPFLAGEVDSIYLVYNEFKSAITQKVVVERLLPISPKQSTDSGSNSAVDYIYEPDQRTILDTILPLYVHVETYRALLESVASEHGARMTAMDNATNNASDMIKRLTLQANRARQAAITTELMEIIGGAEALKG